MELPPKTLKPHERGIRHAPTIHFIPWTADYAVFADRFIRAIGGIRGQTV
jgi:hypothetical protein